MTQWGSMCGFLLPTFRVVRPLQPIVVHPGLALLCGAAQPWAMLSVATMMMVIPTGKRVLWGHPVPHDLRPLWFQGDGLLQQRQVSFGHVEGLVRAVRGHRCGVFIALLTAASWVTSGRWAQLLLQLHQVHHVGVAAFQRPGLPLCTLLAAVVPEQ